MTRPNPSVLSDAADQRWLDEQVAALGIGIEAARAIWTNWFDGRNVGRLHPGVGPGEYIASLGLRLTLPEAMAALPDASTRVVAQVAGVGQSTVVRARATEPSDSVAVRGANGKTYGPRTVTATVIDTPSPPSEVPPIDPLLVDLLDRIEALASTDAARVAATVPERRRAATAKRLRRLGTYLGRIAWLLEGTELPE